MLTHEELRDLHQLIVKEIAAATYDYRNIDYVVRARADPDGEHVTGAIGKRADIEKRYAASLRLQVIAVKLDNIYLTGTPHHENCTTP